MHTINDILSKNIRQYAMLIALIVIIIFFQISTGGILLKPMNVTNLVLQNSYVLILAIGMILCILTGGNIDLSVGAIAAFVAAIVGHLVINMKMGVAPALLIGLLTGIIIGIWQGSLIAYLRIPSFIVTLAGMLLFRGLTITMLKGLTLSPFPESFQKISSGFIPDFFANFGFQLNVTPIVVAIIFSIILILAQIKKRAEKLKNETEVIPFPLFITQLVLIVFALNLFAYWLAAFRGIPIILVILGVLIIGYHFFTTKTVPGRYFYAMGGNEKAARLSGIDTNKVLFFAYFNMAILASLAGVAFASRTNSAFPLLGNGFEMDAIAACFIGGASASGGIGTVIGAIIGALVMGVLNNGMSIMGVGSDWQMTIKGFVLVLAVAFDVLSKNKSKA
ncbi:MAG TPA: sugar ABC transporter permease [Bacillota bacterium]|nr:sugar ABC transporter permease [Bacillota bacterium]HOL09842.1 sugar ABC transporter permease [Bacillota bacterium]HPO97719.1 sugar ABC transporter permease [Bacillota bacterium]